MAMPVNTTRARSPLLLKHCLSRRDSLKSRSWSRRFKLAHPISSSGEFNDNHEGDSYRKKKKKKKRVMVVVDASPEAKIAMLWALSNLVNKLDTLILLHVCINSCRNSTTLHGSSSSSSCRHFHITNFLRSLCHARRPEVDVQAEVVVIEESGGKAANIVKQAKKLEASVLILGQRRPSMLHRFFGRKKDAELVEYCIEHAECLTLGVSKQSSSIGGYLINSKFHKNFWLLA